MAETKINTGLIEGYADMSAEEKVAALENFKYNDLSKELEKAKDAVSKANAEAADWKRKHNALLSDEEQKKQNEDEEKKTLLEKIATLERDARKAEHSKRLVALGYDETLANDTATALVDGDYESVFGSLKKFLEQHDKSLTASLMGKSVEPAAGSGSKTMSKDEFRKLSDKERADFARNHPDEYKNIYGGNT